MGAFSRGDKGSISSGFDRVFTLFPRLRERRSQIAGTLSGGEQQMLATGRAMMAGPRILLMDDDEVVRQVGVQMLELLGYEVAESSDGEEALQRLSEFDAILNQIEEKVYREFGINHVNIQPEFGKCDNKQIIVQD